MLTLHQVISFTHVLKIVSTTPLFESNVLLTQILPVDYILFCCLHLLKKYCMLILALYCYKKDRMERRDVSKRQKPY